MSNYGRFFATTLDLSDRWIIERPSTVSAVENSSRVGMADVQNQPAEQHIQSDVSALEIPGESLNVT